MHVELKEGIIVVRGTKFAKRLCAGAAMSEWIGEPMLN
jgi:hypothetical protein